MIRSIAETRENVLSGEIWKIFEDFFLCHPGSEIFKHVINCDSHAANARLAAALAGFNRDDVLVTHVVMSASQLPIWQTCI